MNKNTKPCASCGEAVVVGVLCCSKCQRENMLQFFKSHPWLKPRDY